MERTERRRRARVRALRGAAAAVLLVPVLAAGAWPACKSDDAGAASTDFDPGPTYGAEVVVSVYGAGRVTSRLGDVDCPGACFARVLLADRTLDGAPNALVVNAQPSFGSHFDHWHLEAIDMGVRARGPARCSPMTRTAVVLPIDERADAVALPFGETKGTPPKGFETDCADFTKVPVAYALSAVFVENFVVPPFDAGPDGGPQDPPLFEPPLGANSGPAYEIGVTGGKVYWRFGVSNTGNSGVATGFADGSAQTIVAQANSVLTTFRVDRHVVFQDVLTGMLEAVPSGGTFATPLFNAPECAAVASDVGNVYCRVNGATSSTLYSWPIGGGPRTTVYQLPTGSALAVDDATQYIYFSDDNGSFGGATIDRVPRFGGGDGGTPTPMFLVTGQPSPRDLVIGPSHMFWLDDRGGGFFSAVSALKSGASNATVSTSGATVRFIAADPDATTYWVGIKGAATGTSSILQVPSGSTSTNVFRARLPSLNGLAVDASWVYWTQNDGRVYRAPKFGKL